MRFNAYAVLAKMRGEAPPRAIRATCAIQPLPNSTDSTNSIEGPADGANSQSAPRSTNSTNSTGQAVRSENAIPLPPALPPHIAAAVRSAFEDYAATDDPLDARAWA